MKKEDFDWNKAFIYVERDINNKDHTMFHVNRNGNTDAEKWIERLHQDIGKLIDKYYKEKLKNKEE